MRSRHRTRFLFVLPMALLAASAAFPAQMASTPARTMGAVMQIGGFMLRPAGVSPASEGDLAPQQLFEIVRPGNQPITLGRMFTSCGCILLEADSRSFESGDRAVLRLRNVIATPPAGQTYSVFVQLTSPINATLRYDTYVQSSQFVPSPDGLQPTRGDIISDGVLIGDAAGIETIVPRADNRAPDASERAPGRKPEDGTEMQVASTGKDAAPGGVPSESGKAPARSAVKDAVDRAGRAADAAARLTPEKTAGAGDSLWEEVRPKTKTKPVLVLE